MATKRRIQTRKRRGQTHKMRRTQRGGGIFGNLFGEESIEDLQAELLKDPNNLELKKQLDIAKAKKIYDESVAQINAQFKNKSETVNLNTSYNNNNNGQNNNNVMSNNGQNNRPLTSPLNGGSRRRNRRYRK